MFFNAEFSKCLKFDFLLISRDKGLLLLPTKIPWIVHLPQATKQPLYIPAILISSQSEWSPITDTDPDHPKLKITVKSNEVEHIRGAYFATEQWILQNYKCNK